MFPRRHPPPGDDVVPFGPNDEQDRRVPEAARTQATSPFQALAPAGRVTRGDRPVSGLFVNVFPGSAAGDGRTRPSGQTTRTKLHLEDWTTATTRLVEREGVSYRRAIRSGDTTETRAPDDLDHGHGDGVRLRRSPGRRGHPGADRADPQFGGQAGHSEFLRHFSSRDVTGLLPVERA